jgi:pyruvate kinase
MISNSSSIPRLAGGFITLDTVKAPTIVKNRRSKIICTLGPACWEVEKLETLMDAGMNVARFNFSHGDHEGHKACLDRLRTAAANKNRNIGTCISTFSVNPMTCVSIYSFAHLVPSLASLSNYSCFVGH